MYIIWSGRGFFVLLILLIAYISLLGYGFTDNEKTTYSFLISGPVIYLLSLYFNLSAAKIKLARAEEGEISTLKKMGRDAVHGVFGDPADRPKFFFIPMAWWGGAVFILGLVFQFTPS